MANMGVGEVVPHLDKYSASRGRAEAASISTRIDSRDVAALYARLNSSLQVLDSLQHRS